jgi:two-component system sensor histidine kinase/response regulator
MANNILIVDDTPTNLHLLSQMLSEHGYKVRPVRSAIHALTAAHAAPPDLILLDIIMPEMDGYEVCQRLKDDERTRDIPVLFISALGSVGDKVKAFTSGGVDFVTKPFQAEEVLARVQTHLTLRRLTQELQAANAELSRRNEELRAQNAELDTFAHTVAHDLKNPMATIIGYAASLEEAWGHLDADDITQSLRFIIQGGEKMCNITDELLLLATIRKQTQVQVQPLNMGQIIDAAQKRLISPARDSQAEIVGPERWPVALGYAPWVEEVWVNYLSNALKYGGSTPVVELGATVQPDARVCFWVRDNGAGIPPEKQAMLFTEFTQLNGVRMQGYGLGLSIVRRIVERLGGQVGVESEAGEGSTFWFALPAAE